LHNQDLEFIGQKYLKPTLEETEAKKQEILASYDKFQLDKITWLNNVYIEETTKKPLWSVYNNNIHDYEVAKNKDLKDFQQEEVVSMMKSFIYVAPMTLGSIKAFVNRYFDYWVEKGYITINPILGEKSLKGIKSNKKMLETKIYNMDEFYDLLRQMKEVTKSANIKPLLLGRYGIQGKQLIHMRSLKYKDIDIENKFVNIYDENNKFLTLIPIDNQFIDFLAELDDIVDEDSKKKLYESDVYVLETREIVNYNTVNSRVYNAFKYLNKNGKENIEDWEKVPRISFNDLLFTRQIELLLQIRKTRKISILDINSIVDIFGNIKGTAFSKYHIQEKYESLTKDKVLLIQGGYAKFENKMEILKVNMIDPLAYDTVNEICESIGLNID
jgi:hypothetical protein